MVCALVLFTCWLNLSVEIHRMHSWLSYSNVKNASWFCACKLSNILTLTSLQLRWALLTENPLWNQSRDSLKFYLLGLVGFFTRRKETWSVWCLYPHKEYFHECRQCEREMGNSANFKGWKQEMAKADAFFYGENVFVVTCFMGCQKCYIWLGLVHFKKL